MNSRPTIGRSSRIAIALLACALLPAALTRCGAAVNGEYGTETGNPPVIQKAKLRLVVNGDELRLVGEPGALPPNASVRVTNQRTSVVIEATAGSDGSLELAVDGERTDSFELVVVTAGGEASVTVSATDLPLDLSTLSCAGLRDAKDNVVAAAFAEADQSCATDLDCTADYWGTFCYNPCKPFVASRDAFVAASFEAEGRVAPLCTQELQSNCPAAPAPICAPLPPVLCEDNRCVVRERVELDCAERGRDAVRERQAIVDRAYRVCQVDADCALANDSNECMPACGFSAAIAASASDIIAESLQGLDDFLCRQLTSAGCSGSVSPPCTQPAGTTTPICVQGQCETLFEPSEQD